MDEIIMQVARAVASMPRLKILSRLARREEMTPTVLAQELRMSLPDLCAHLRRLSMTGLIRRRRSGKWSYAVGASPYGEASFSGRIARWLFHVLESPGRTLRGRGLRSGAGGAETELHRVIFEAATAFTNVRRLYILRELCGGNSADAEELCGKLKMSSAALSRHGHKLVVRGYLRSERAGHSIAYALEPKSKTALHRELWDIVKEEQRKKDFTVG